MYLSKFFIPFLLSVVLPIQANADAILLARQDSATPTPCSAQCGPILAATDAVATCSVLALSASACSSCLVSVGQPTLAATIAAGASACSSATRGPTSGGNRDLGFHGVEVMTGLIVGLGFVCVLLV